jgi:hypothetical protein
MWAYHRSAMTLYSQIIPQPRQMMVLLSLLGNVSSANRIQVEHHTDSLRLLLTSSRRLRDIVEIQVKKPNMSFMGLNGAPVRSQAA